MIVDKVLPPFARTQQAAAAQAAEEEEERSKVGDLKYQGYIILTLM